MQEDAVERVHRVLGDLQPVAGIVDRVGDELVAGQLERVENREFRSVLGRPEIGEDEALYSCVG